MAAGPNYGKIDRLLGFVAAYGIVCILLLMTLGLVVTFKLTWESW